MSHNYALPFYLCTGFHRSGTSLLAQTLSANGMQMGNELMGATFSNPLGHVEDMPIVCLHDKLYSLNGCDWRYHDSCALIKPVWVSNYIHTYIQDRQSTSPSPLTLNGVKDPRAVHFLKDWQTAGQENIRYIFIYRHWRDACFSLLNRHARHLLNNAHDIQRNALNVSFWQQASLAFDMWHSANSRILEFYQTHPDQCILLAQEALAFCNDVPDTVADKIGLSADIFKLQTYKSELMSQRPLADVFDVLDAKKSFEMDKLYDELQAFADYPVTSKTAMTMKESHKGHFQTSLNQQPVLSSEPQTSFQTQLSDWLNAQLARKFSAAAGQEVVHEQKVINIFEHSKFDFTQLNWAEYSGALLRVPVAKIGPVPFHTVLCQDSLQHSLHADYFAVAKLAHKQGLWLISKLLKIRAMITHSLASKDSPKSMLNPWQLSMWTLFCQAQPDALNESWICRSDKELDRVNPFSLRTASELPERYQDVVQDDILCSGATLSELTSLEIIKLSPDHEHYERSISAWLLLNECETAEAYCNLAQHARHHIHIAEFCLLKALRIASQKENENKERRELAKVLGELALHYAVQKMREYSQSCLTALSSISMQDHDRVLSALPKPAVPIRPAAGLKHRFALLPHSLPYDQIISIGYANPSLGNQYDLFNRRICLLAKDNIEWLHAGVEGLNQSTARSLVACISKHWEKVFPRSILGYIFDLEDHKFDIKHAQQSARQLCLKHAPCILVDVNDVDSFAAFCELYALLQLNNQDAIFTLFVYVNRHVAQNPKLMSRCVELAQSLQATIIDIDIDIDIASASASASASDAASTMQTHNQQGLSQQLSSHLIGVQLALQAFNQFTQVNDDISNEHYIGLIDCSTSAGHQDRSHQVLAWYSMLGFEFGGDLSRTLSQTLNEDTAKPDMPVLILPSYHPSVIWSIQDKPPFYPLNNMLWITNTCAQDMLSIKALNKQQLNTLFLNRVKQRYPEVTTHLVFMHQLLRSYFL